MPLPHIAGVGSLHVVEVYEYFDGPVLFTGRNQRGELFLVTLSGDEPGGKSWLCAPLSVRRHQQVRSGGIDLHTAFADVEGGEVLRVVVPRTGEPLGVWVKRDTLVADELPLAGERLNLDTVTLAERPDLNVGLIAAQTRREVVTLRLDIRDTHRSEAPAATLGQILVRFQGLLNSMGEARAPTPKKGLKPVNVTQEMRLDVASAFAGSFGVEMHARTDADLFGNSEIGETITNLAALLGSTEDEKALTVQIESLKRRSAVRLRDLALTMVGAIDKIRIDWGSPRAGRGGEIVFTVAGAQRAIDIIGKRKAEEPEDFTVLARLVGLNTRAKTYEVWDVEENVKYAGRILDDALPGVEHAVMSDVYFAEIREETETIATGEVVTKYKLKSLTPQAAPPAEGTDAKTDTVVQGEGS